MQVVAQKQRFKHIPQRTCVVCHQKMDKRRLTRVVRTSNAGVVIDPTGKRNGRGAYLCDVPGCWNRALNSQILSQALKTKITDAEREAIAEYRPK